MNSNDTGTLIDSNVLLDLLTRDPNWYRWSASHVATASDRGPLVINQVVYGEISHGFVNMEVLDEALGEDRFVRSNLPWPAAFLAARAYQAYRRRGGTRTSTLPDFFIGAHAAVLGLRLLTRDASRYRTYFPTLEIICP